MRAIDFSNLDVVFPLCMYTYAHLSIFPVYPRQARRVFLFLSRALLIHHGMAHGIHIRVSFVVYRFNHSPFYASVDISVVHCVFAKIHRAVNITIL